MATNEIATHLIELGHKTASDHERVLMMFVQSNRDCHGAEDTLVALKLRLISRERKDAFTAQGAHVLKTGGMTELDKEMQGALVFQWASARRYAIKRPSGLQQRVNELSVPLGMRGRRRIDQREWAKRVGTGPPAFCFADTRPTGVFEGFRGWSPDMKFTDRSDAGRRLAGKLVHLKERRPVVLALPRGGVAIGFEIAQSLSAPLDIVLVRKIGVPWQRELAVGAVTDGATPEIFIDRDLATTLEIPEIAG